MLWNADPDEPNFSSQIFGAAIPVVSKATSITASARQLPNPASHDDDWPSTRGRQLEKVNLDQLGVSHLGLPCQTHSNSA